MEDSEPLDINAMRTPSNGKDKTNEKEELMEQLTLMEQELQTEKDETKRKLDEEYIDFLKKRLQALSGGRSRKNRQSRKSRKSRKSRSRKA